MLFRSPTIEERVAACKSHFEFSLRWKGEKLGVLEMRRHYTNYFKGIPNFKPFRMDLVTSMDIDFIRKKLDDIAQFEI